MISLQVSTIMQMDHGGSLVRVATKRCVYRVEVTLDNVVVQAPGLEESFDRPEHPMLFDPDLSNEGAAAIAVLYFEESNQ